MRVHGTILHKHLHLTNYFGIWLIVISNFINPSYIKIILTENAINTSFGSDLDQIAKSHKLILSLFHQNFAQTLDCSSLIHHPQATLDNIEARFHHFRAVLRTIAASIHQWQVRI
jgi:hypothetical protein